MEEIIRMLPETIKSIIEAYQRRVLKPIEEIRIRVNRPLEVISNGRPEYPSMSSDANGRAYFVTVEDGVHLLNKLSQFSLYAFEEELRRGYITIKGGHRVGLAGKVITEKGQVKVIRDVSSFNIRVATQKEGTAERWAPYLYKNRWLNTLIIGPPQSGKTTFLRDVARIASQGTAGLRIRSSKVGIVDERSEIAGCIHGVPQHNLGPRVDVLDSCPKAEGIMMMIRSLSPEVIIVDEIGRQEDAEAILEALNAGVQMIMTAHGYGIENVLKRPIFQRLMEIQLFDRFIEMSQSSGPSRVKRILDAEFNPLMISKNKVST
ncbi:stage III sporulation protein AA [Pseudalkalibacillus sp. SCS-8]|uniref:stage III sporulation protein AA n=1 Tax=Pseudalkalibacillus nanhaiensis TaxID=3115291 RepID=UPI0032D9CC56